MLIKCIIYELFVRSFHFILLIIQPDRGVVLVMDPKRKALETWADMQECIQKYNFNHYGTILATFLHLNHFIS